MLEQIKEDVRRYALQADREGLCRHRSGNFSIRDAESGLICITPTGMDRTEMTADDIVAIDMDGHTIESLNERKPTSELMMHTAIYRSRSDVRAVAHTHSRAATAFAVMNKPIPAIVYELSILGCREGYVPVAPYGRPGTKAAAENVLAPLAIADVALMQAHGVVAGEAAFLVEHVKVFADALADAGRVYLDVFINVARRAVAELGKDAAVAAIRQGDGDDVFGTAQVFVDEALFLAAIQQFPALRRGQGGDVVHGCSSLAGQL